MARETKVGLLAGLIFIVCFAVILANRSGQGRIAEQMPSFLAQPSPFGPSSMGPAVQPGVSSSGPSNVAASWNRDADPSSRPRISPGPLPGRQSSHTPLTRQSPSNNQQAFTAQDQPRRAFGGSTQPVVLSSTNARYESTVSNATQAEAASHRRTPTQAVGRGQRSQPRQAIAQVEPKRVDPKPPVDRRSKRGRRRAATAIHRVIQGDTLTRIASEYYGSRSGKLVQAIYQANRTTLRSPDALQVGFELALPAVSGFDGPNREKSRTNQARVPKAARPKPSPRKADPAAPSAPTRWYQIRENDRYVTIARRELHDAGRWHEIHELNRKLFPDPDVIRPGVRIRLPALKAVAIKVPALKMAGSRERRR